MTGAELTWAQLALAQLTWNCIIQLNQQCIVRVLVASLAIVCDTCLNELMHAFSYDCTGIDMFS